MSIAHAPVDAASVGAALGDVPDPEIPGLSIVDLGLVDRLDLDADRILVQLLPTFVGCPALDVIRSSVEARLADFGLPVEVVFSYRVPWTSDRISRVGRAKLQAAGFAPPSGNVGSLIDLDVPVPCPLCGSRRTLLENAFGPTQCRTIRYCTSCRQPFEAFKEV